MKTIPAGSVLAAAILGLVLWSAGEVRAETTSLHLTPAKMGDHLLTFEVRVEPQPDRHGAMWHVEVTVKPAKGKEFPLPRKVATLELKEGKAMIVEAELAPTIKAGATIYSFRVAAKSADKSRFIFGNTLDGSDGNSDLINQGHFCWFHLTDFLPAEPEGKKP